jgi:sugar phosphate isomerase/epimerase
MELKLGATTRPWDKWSFDQACQSISNAGYEEVSVYFNEGRAAVTSASSDEEIAKAVDIVKKNKINATMLISSPRLDLDVEEAIEDYRKLIDANAKLGCKWLMNGGTENKDLYSKYFDIMRECAPYAEEKGMEIGEAKFKLRDIRQARLESKTMIHSFDIDKFKEIVEGKGLSTAKIVSEDAKAAIDDYYFRRYGLIISILITNLLAFTIYRYIVLIEKKK